MEELANNLGEKIYFVRGQKVMLDEDLAKIYGVETRTLNQAVSRNRKRFPKEFMFQLTEKEVANLTSQVVISRWGGRRKMPFVFTEHGAVMLASILRSDRAIEMSIEVVKTFVRLRSVLNSHKDMMKQLSEIRSFMLKSSSKNNQEFKKVWEAIGKLGSSVEKPPIGFRVD